MFGRSDENSDLERRLRDERPRPSEDLVQRLASRFEPAPRPIRRGSMPRIAIIAAVTAGLALSLGAAGAIGSATGSIHLFGTSVFHLVQPSSARSTPPVGLSNVTPEHSQSGQGQNGQGLGPWNFSFHHFPPFMNQYAGLIPICFHGHIIYVTPFQWFWYFIHGAGPARSCFSPHH